MSNLIDNLKPGDVLLYGPSSLYGKLIAIKTWHSISHCEGYDGDGFSVASRDGKGVSRYPFRPDVKVVLRPRLAFNEAAAASWFATVNGQKYDWWGLLRFVLTGESSHVGNNNKMFCSEFLTRWLRVGGIDPFNGDDADAIAPFEFMISPLLERLDVKSGVR